MFTRGKETSGWVSGLVAAGLLSLMALPLANAQGLPECDCEAFAYSYSGDPDPECAFSNATISQASWGVCQAAQCGPAQPCKFAGSLWAINQFGEDCGYFKVFCNGVPIASSTDDGIVMDFSAKLRCGSQINYEIYAGGALEIGLALICESCLAAGG